MAFNNSRAGFGEASGSCSTLPTDQGNVTVSKKLKENVMPLDLAIKRELDYRMKIENLQGISLDVKKTFVSFQGSGSVSTTSTLSKKRKTMSNNLRFSNNDSTQQQQQLICLLCKLSFRSKSALRQHRLDNNHKAKLMETQKNKTTKNKPQWCKLCRISCSDERALAQHIAGKKHAASVHAIEAAKSIKEEAENKLFINWEELEWDMVS